MESDQLIAQPIPREKRINRRRLTKRGVDIICRRGMMGLGPNLALGILNLSDDGVQLRLKERLEVGMQVEVSLTPPGRSKPIVREGEVRWAGEEDSGTFLHGIQFRKRLVYTDFSLFF